jgi:hypothetical protein
MNGRCDQCEIAAQLCNQWITVEFEMVSSDATREFCRMECLANWSKVMMEEDE